MKNGELIDMQSIEYTKDEILMCHDVLCVLANTNLKDLHTGTVELIGVDDQGREGYSEVDFQEYVAKAAAILGSVTAAPAAQGVQGVPVGVRSLLVECERALCCSDPAQRQATASKVLRALTAAQHPAEHPDPTEAQILAITTAYEQGVGKGHEAHRRVVEIQNPYGASWGCDKAWQMGYEEGKEQAADIAKSSADKPRPEPDVTQLVEALTMARETIASALRANAPDYFTTDADIARHVVIQRIDIALAAHREQGGEA